MNVTTARFSVGVIGCFPTSRLCCASENPSASSSSFPPRRGKCLWMRLKMSLPGLMRFLVPAGTALAMSYASGTFSHPIYAQAEDNKGKKSSDTMQKVREAIVEIIERDAEQRGDGTSLYGTMIRLAWHCSGTYSQFDGTGGSNGAKIRFDPEASWGANAGLKVARDALEPVKAQFPDWTYADLYTYAGVVAVEEAGGPNIPFRIGRTDDADGSTSPDTVRLPDADKGSRVMTIQHVRDVFYRMGFTDRDIVALLGAHAMGRCHTDRSGYWGPWTRAESTFSNEYYRLLLQEKWTPKLTHNGKPWTGPDQYEDVSTGQLMMLPSDLALIQDPDFLKYVELYAKDEDQFFKDFANAFAKLLELGVPFPATKAWYQFW